MFESIRTHRKWLMPIIFLVVFVPFVISGIYGFTNLFTESNNTVAKVDGEPITQQELESAQRERIDRMVQMLGGKIDPHLLDTPQARAATLDTLLSERSLMQETRRVHLAVTEKRLQDVILAIPQFQVNGRFDEDAYKTLLASRGMTPAGFEAQVRTDLLRQTLTQGIVESAVLPKSVAERLWTLQHEKRELRMLRFKPEDYLAKAAVGEDAIKADYEANRQRYQTPETAKIEFVVLRPEDVAARISVADADVKAFYEANKARWSEPEQRRASHILITAGKDGSAPDKDGARKIAEDLLKQLHAAPDGFAKLAREHSKDPGSADKGGDLGWFGRGMMDPRFEQAAFALKDGETSGVVETDFGFHIIRVTGIKPGQTKPLDQVRGQIEDELRRQAAQKSFADLAEQFTNFVYEQSDGLAAAADKFKLPLQTADHVTRQGAPQLSPAAAQALTPQVLDAVFAPDSIAKRHNTKAIEIAGSALVSARVLDYQPAAVQPLEQVHAAIKTSLERAAAADLARKTGAARLAELQKQPDDAGFEAPLTVGRDAAQGLPPAALSTVMALAADKLPAYAGVELPGDAYAVVHVLAVKPAEAVSTEQRERDLGGLLQQFGAEDQRAYIEALRQRFDAKVVRSDLSAPVRKAPAGDDAP